MTREERIRDLNLSPEKEREFHSVYTEYEGDERKRCEKALRWRLEHLIPKSQLLLEKRYSSRKNIKCLFVLVGTSIEPLLLSILTHRPSKKLVLIYSSESKKQKKIVEHTLLQKSGQHRIQKNWLYDKKAKSFIDRAKELSMDDVEIKDTTPQKVFAAIKSRTASFQASEIGVDITGGKKSMVGGGFLAASINDCHLFYVDFDEYYEDKPVQGTEFINILPNPYDIYNIELLSQAKELFRHHNYQASFSLFEKIIEKFDSIANFEEYDLSEEKEVVRNMLLAAKCYVNWDEYSYDEACDSSGCLDENQKRHLEGLKVYEKYQTKKDCYSSSYFYNFVIDRFLSAQRRWFNKDSAPNVNAKDDLRGYYDAMLRYFQCIEVMIDAFITKNEKDVKYDPDNKQCLLTMDNKRDLCFKGRYLKKFSRDNCDNIEYILENTISPHDLKGRIKILNNQRDNFVHVKPVVQCEDIREAERLVKELMRNVFDKNEAEIDKDITSFTFKRSFDKNGNLC